MTEPWFYVTVRLKKSWLAEILGRSLTEEETTAIAVAANRAVLNKVTRLRR
jgi:hypothetical protein